MNYVNLLKDASGYYDLADIHHLYGAIFINEDMEGLAYILYNGSHIYIKDTIEPFCVSLAKLH